VLLVTVLVLGISWFGYRRYQATELSSTPTAQPHSQVVSRDSNEAKVWTPPHGLVQRPIWPDRAPGEPGAPEAPERVLTKHTPEAIGGETSQAVFDVSQPTLTIFPPTAPSVGTGVVVFPGGGYSAVVMTLEGTEICDWLAAKGITCILVKYRVPESGHHWDKNCNCGVTPKVPKALQDAQRAVKIVRSEAAKHGIDPQRIGVMGFSAGGYLAVQLSNIAEPAYVPRDAIDKTSSRPDFAIVFFPGHICRPGRVMDPGLRVTKQTPPTFLAQAWDDPVDDVCNSLLYARALMDAGVPAEVHLFAKGGHAFGLRKSNRSIALWPSQLEAWMSELGVLRPKPS